MALNEQLAFNNSKVQRLRRLLGRRSSRTDEQAFVVEGAVLIREAISAGWAIECEFVTAGTDPVSDAPWFALDGGVMERVASTERPQPNIAVVAMPPAATALDEVNFAVVLDRLSDPGNLGTILRSSEAAGVDAVILTPGSVDPFNPKVVRASAGALFHLPIIDATIESVSKAGLRLLGTSSHLGSPHTEAVWGGRIALILGNEAHGIPVDAPVDAWVCIEHRGRAESLNVAMAATVLSFEAARQRAQPE